MYYLTTTAKRKNAKRHIVMKSDSIEELKKIAENNINPRYIAEIYDGKWNLIYKR